LLSAPRRHNFELVEFVVERIKTRHEVKVAPGGMFGREQSPS
jgi:hypothetical protein